MTVDAWLQPLSPRQRQIVERLLFFGATVPSIAVDLAISRGATRAHLNRALRRLGLPDVDHLRLRYQELHHAELVQEVAARRGARPDHGPGPPLSPAAGLYLMAFEASGWPARRPTVDQRRVMDACLVAGLAAKEDT